MGLISVANLQALTDKMGAAWEQLLPIIGTSSGSPVAGTTRWLMAEALDIIVSDADDFQQQLDLGQTLSDALTLATTQRVLKTMLQASLNAINNHCALRGPAVDSTIVSLTTYLAYYNGGSGGSAYSSMLSNAFRTLWEACRTDSLNVAGIFSPAIAPVNGNADGMGKRAVGGAFSDGAAVDTTKHSAVELVAEIITDFANGGSAPTLTVAGTDDAGATSTTWTATLTGNNPTAAKSTTITPAISSLGRQTVATGSGTGIVAGSILTVNDGLEDEETIIVETVASNDITAVFKKTHGAGAALTGQVSVALTPSVAGKRCRDVSGITIGIGTHDAGQVRIIGKQVRVPYL